MIILITLLFIIIAVEAITEIIVASDLFTELRGWFSRKGQNDVFLNFISRLISCGYCCSVWVAGAIAWCIPLSLTGYWYMDVIIKLFTVHRLSNWYHEFMSRWFGRHPWTCVIHKVGKR